MRQFFNIAGSCLIVASVVVPTIASATDYGEPVEPVQQVAPEAADAEVVDLEVHVSAPDDQMNPAAAAGVSVRVSTIEPPHRVVDTVEVVTDDAGVARVSLPTAAGRQAYASAQIGGRELFSDQGVALDEPGSGELRISESVTTSDTSSVFAPRLITIAELWEDYVVFTQIWRLSSTGALQVTPESSERTSGLRIPLPEDASGVRVVQPAEGVQVVDGVLFYQLPIQPAGVDDGDGAPAIVVRFSLKHDNASELEWEQELAFPVENASVVIPQQSGHARHPAIDVALDVPLCDSSDASVDEMCFAELRDTADGVSMLDGVAVRVAGGGYGERGSVMRVRTTGWPSPFPLAEVVSTAAVLFALLGLFVLWRREREAGAFAPISEHERLEQARARIHEQAREARAQWLDGVLLESEYEARIAALKEELSVVVQQLTAIERGVPAGRA